MISGIKPNGKRIGRRDALRLTGQAGLAAAGTVLLGRCKGSTTPDPEPPPLAVDVLVRFYNHTQGYIGEKVYSGLSGSPLAIKVSDCPDISTVNPHLIAVREPINNGWLGRYIEYSWTGELFSTKYPKQNAEYAAFLMNSTHGTDYIILDSGTYYLGLLHGINATWDREDYDATGPDEIPREAMRQIKETLALPWIKYMDFTELSPYVRGDFWVGYAPGSNPELNLRGGFSEGCAWANPLVCATDVMKLRVFIEQIFGHITMSYISGSTGGPTATYDRITDDNGINLTGRELLTYSLARDRLRYA